MLDVTGPAERTGKRRGTDLLDGTVTLPLILARERSPELAALDLRDDRRARRGRADLRARSRPPAPASGRAGARSSSSPTAKRELPADCPPLQRRALELMADGLVERFA